MDDPAVARSAVRSGGAPRHGGDRRRGVLHLREQQGSHGVARGSDRARRQAVPRVGRPQPAPHHRELGLGRLRGQDGARHPHGLRSPRRARAPREAPLVDRRLRRGAHGTRRRDRSRQVAPGPHVPHDLGRLGGARHKKVAAAVDDVPPARAGRDGQRRAVHLGADAVVPRVQDAPRRSRPHTHAHPQDAPRLHLAQRVLHARHLRGAGLGGGRADALHREAHRGPGRRG
mmetsp:Transcript_14860/g.59555  ORF Transcript_14860/g.59555 Transcript_14860/m.59555 type:complete len:230 (+) Transcript_14860:492-1181(+)